MEDEKELIGILCPRKRLLEYSLPVMSHCVPLCVVVSLSLVSHRMAQGCVFFRDVSISGCRMQRMVFYNAKVQLNAGFPLWDKRLCGVGTRLLCLLSLGISAFSAGVEQG